MYDVFRLEKVKSLSSISAMKGHWDRSRETPNAAPERTDLNRVLHGSGDVYEDARAALEGVKVPKNGVPLIEGVTQPPPEYVRAPGQGPGQWDEAKLAAWTEAKMAWLRKEFGDRLVGAVLHLDEETPHVHFAVVPKVIDKKGAWKVSASSITGGAAKMAALQSKSAACVAHLGIKRGIEKSVAKHVSPSQHKADLLRKEAELAEREKAVQKAEERVARAERVALVEEGRTAVNERLVEAHGDVLVPGEVLRERNKAGDPTAKPWWEAFKARVEPVVGEVLAYAKAFAKVVGAARLDGFERGRKEFVTAVGEMTMEQSRRVIAYRDGIAKPKPRSEWELE